MQVVLGIFVFGAAWGLGAFVFFLAKLLGQGAQDLRPIFVIVGICAVMTAFSAAAFLLASTETTPSGKPAWRRAFIVAAAGFAVGALAEVYDTLVALGA